MTEEKIPLVVVAGPTASGKTRLAIELAKAYNGEVVSADSMQIYRCMAIGTAQPTEEEMEGIPHHLIRFLDPGESFSVVQYVQMAGQVIADIHARGKLPILAGGTGLYINSLVDGIDFTEIESDPVIRQELTELAEEQGNEAIWAMLHQVDPALAEKLHPNNLGRIIRALEVYRITGKPMSWHQEQSRLHPSPYRPCMLGITYRDRQALYDRINLRVTLMAEQGLLEEADQLFRSPFAGTASQAIGYKELLPYFEGTAPLEECLDKVRQQSRRYAKRQLTWFRKDERIHWLEADTFADYDALLREAKNILELSGIL